jgi:CUB domain
MEWLVHGLFPRSKLLNFKMCMIGCGGKFDAPYGTLQSPNYPNSYPQNTECRWEIAVDWDKSIELTIVDLAMESSQDCAFDSLKVPPFEFLFQENTQATCF